MGITTIKIDAKTRKELARLKSSPRETYDDLVQKLIRLIPQGDDEGRFRDAFRAGLLQARLDTVAGRAASLAEACKRLGLKSRPGASGSRTRPWG